MMRLRTFVGSHHEGRVRVRQIHHGGRIRGGHDNNSCMIGLIDAVSAGERLSIAADLLEAGARLRMVPHYWIAGHLRFDPRDLEVWVRKHRIDEIGADQDR